MIYYTKAHEFLQVKTIHVICQSDYNKKRKIQKQNLTKSHKIIYQNN